MIGIINIKLNNMSINPNIPLIVANSGLAEQLKEFIVTSFVNIKYSAQHHGAAHGAPAVDAAQEMPRGFSATRGLAALLLSAVAAAVIIVAYQVMDSVAEGHLLVMWVGLWAVAFAALALFAGAARQIAVRTKNGLDAWSRNVAQARADQRLWALAKADPRVMTDLQMAMMRSDVQTEVIPVPASTPAARAERAIRQDSRGLRDADSYSNCF